MKHNDLETENHDCGDCLYFDAHNVCCTDGPHKGELRYCNEGPCGHWFYWDTSDYDVRED
jgi:hypothetical protein